MFKGEPVYVDSNLTSYTILDKSGKVVKTCKYFYDEDDRLTYTRVIEDSGVWVYKFNIKGDTVCETLYDNSGKVLYHSVR